MTNKSIPTQLGDLSMTVMTREEWSMESIESMESNDQVNTLISSYEQQFIFPNIMSDINDLTSNHIWLSEQQLFISAVNSSFECQSLPSASPYLNIDIMSQMSQAELQLFQQEQVEQNSQSWEQPHVQEYSMFNYVSMNQNYQHFSRKIKNKITKIRNINIKQVIKGSKNRKLIWQLKKQTNQLKTEPSTKNVTKSYGYFFMCLALLYKQNIPIPNTNDVFGKPETTKKNRRSHQLCQKQKQIILSELDFTKKFVETFNSGRFLESILMAYMRNEDILRAGKSKIHANKIKGMQKTAKVLDKILGKKELESQIKQMKNF